MKCIYCSDYSDLTVSDIIPAALTGAKIKKKFVCRKHNSFTNDNYERTMIRQLDIFRNRIGLTERDGDAVRFWAELTIGDYTSLKPINISDNKSVMDTDRVFKMKDKNGKSVLVGPKDKLLKISGASLDNITDLPLADVVVSSKMDIRDLFISETVLHAIAKIAYEWHCYVNDVEEFCEEYSDIVSYILDPEQINTLVYVVNDLYVNKLTERFSRTGSNMLFEYKDSDGNIYVVFSLWNVIAYKIKVCRHDEKTSLVHCPMAYFYHADGTQNGTMFAVCGDFHVKAMPPDTAIYDLCLAIKTKLSELGERDLSREYLWKCIGKIEKDLPAYKEHKISIAELLDFENKDRVVPVYVLEQIFIHKDEYALSETFNKNIQRILRTEDRFVLTEETIQKILDRYLCMDVEGTFATLLEEAIEFFKGIERN